MSVTRKFKSIKELLAWRKAHPKRRISQVTETSTAPPPTYTKRELVVQLCHWGITHNASIHYAQTRPIPLRSPRLLPALPLTTDCSGWATIAYRYAGAADPGGSSYSGQNNTGTFLKHMRHIAISAVKAGDIVVYGAKTYPGYGHHAAVITNAGSHTVSTITTCSHGSEAGPLAITVAAEAKYQPDGLAGIVYLTSIA